MKRIALALALVGALLFVPVAQAQSPARFDLPTLMTTPAQVPVGSLPALLAVTNATVSICGYPATLVNGMCTNTITTYTDATEATACPSTAQLTSPGTSVCVSTTGLQGAFGFWYDTGAQTHMTYTIQTNWGTFGPYDIAPGGGGSAAGAVLTAPNSSDQTISHTANGATTLTVANPSSGSGASSGYLASNGTDFFALELAGTGTGIPGAATFAISNATAPLDFQTGGGPILFNAPNTNISGALNYAADTGSANAYVVAPPSCVSATHAGTTINFKAANASTGASTLVYCTGSPVTLEKNGSTALTTGDILAGAQYSARFDGTYWQLLNSSLTGGGGGSPAGSNGNLQINASSSFGAATNVFYQQSGDTISSIETECSSLCTYVVTSPQTITLSASHAMNSNVFVDFAANGKWTVNGAFTLSNIQVGTSELTQHFAGSSTIALSAYNTLVPVEWFGATGNGSTDDTAAIQATINAISYGQILLQPTGYLISSAISIAKVYVGIRGTNQNAASATGSRLFTNSASIDIVDLSSGGNNVLEDFGVTRTVIPTGTAAGIRVGPAVGCTTLNDIRSADSVYDFYSTYTPSCGNGIWSNLAAVFTLETAANSYYGFYLNSASGQAENSLRIIDSEVSNNTGSTTPITYGMILYGTAVNDVMTKGFETAGTTYGQVVDYTGTGPANGAQDIHFSHSIIDSYGINAFLIENIPASERATVTIDDAWMSGSGASTAAVRIANSSSVIVTHSQIKPTTGSAYYVTGSDSVILSNNLISETTASTGNPAPVELSGTSHSSVTGNTITASSGNYPAIIYLTGNSTYNAVTGNSIQGYSTTGAGIGIDAGSNYNTCCTANTVDLTHITSGRAVSDSGSYNGLTSPVKIFTPTTENTDYQVGILLTGANNLEGFNNNTPTDAYNLGWLLPGGGTPGTNVLFNVYGGSSWQTAWSVNPSTLATAFAGAVTAPSFAATGIVDGEAPITTTTTTPVTLGGTYHSGYTFNNDGATAVTYTLPTAAAGLQYCVANYTGATGTLKVATSATGQFIDNAGANTASGGYVISGGALGDAGCFVGMSSTNWKLYIQGGTWTTH